MSKSVNPMRSADILDIEKGVEMNLADRRKSAKFASPSVMFAGLDIVKEDKKGALPGGSENDSVSQKSLREYFFLPSWVLTALIVTLGAGTAAAFLAFGITSSNRDQSASFERLGTDLVKKVEDALEDYSTAASYIHGRCRHRNFTRDDFREGYEYLVASGLEFKALQFDPNITHDQREAAETEAREYYARYYPHVKYAGFSGFNFPNQTGPEPRVNASFYFPIHYMEPIETNEAAIDLDYHAPGSPQRHNTVMYCMSNGMPAITDRLRLVQETAQVAYGVVLMHP
jgi:CHASE1-domain containing sensor protein